MSDDTTKQAKRVTVGLLAGWHMYNGTIPLNYLELAYQGVYAAAQKQGCNLLLACGINRVPYQPYPAWPIPSPGIDFVPVGAWNADGLIVFPGAHLTTLQSAYLQELTTQGYPIVYVTKGESGPTIAVDGENGIRQALIHLMDHGHRRIAFVSGFKDRVGDGQERWKAFQTLAPQYGLEIDERLIAEGNFTQAGGRQAMRQILDTGISFTAVLASNDASAIGAMDMLRESGRRIPEDVAVIGFDDQLVARAQQPPLTTLRQPIFEMGYRALHWLLRIIGGEPSLNEVVLYPARLVIRRSCGCQPGGAALSPHHAAPVSLAASPSAEPLPELDAAQVRLAQTMSRAVLAETQRFTTEEVSVLCRQIVEALSHSLNTTQPEPFWPTFTEALRVIETRKDEVYVWQIAFEALAAEVAALLADGDQPTLRCFGDTLLNQSRLTLSEHVRWQYAHALVEHATSADQLGMMATHLSVALEEGEILRVLAEWLPRVGIGRSYLAFYEPEGEDPYAWSRLFTITPTGATDFSASRQLFQTRQFPLPTLTPPGEPFRLAVLPLVIQETLAGFMAFDTVNFNPCAAIVYQLGSAIRDARLYRAAAEANRVKSRFLSTVSHELRTPLNLIAGLSEMLLLDEFRANPPLPAVYREDIEHIHRSAQHLSRLIRDVLDLASSDSGQLRLEVEPVDLTEMLEVVIVTGEQLTRGKGLTWEANVPDVLPNVWGDHTRLRQVALNLVSNAVKFTAQGKITLTVEIKEDQVVVSVSDTGVGIPLEDQAAIFDEFRQSERTTNRGYGGLGLGLSISKRLVELHGGNIGVQSSGQEGEGATFYFTLPIMHYVEELSPSAAHKHQTIFLLSDQPNHTGEIQAQLEQKGFETKNIQVGSDPTRWLPSLLAASPSAVLLDSSLATQRGWEIMKLLKGHPATRSIPVVFYSLPGENNAGSLLELDYIAKPLAHAELTQALERQGLLATPLTGEKTILIVDDEPGTLEMHARMVQAQSPAYRILKARNGREALEIIDRETPDLVLLDLMMPEMDGFGVLEAIRKGDTPNLPVIVLTAQVLTESDMARLNQGVATVLGKGMFNPKEILGHLEAALARYRKLGSESQRIVRKAMAYLHAHYAEDISRDKVARYVGVSERHLTRCFREELGITPMTYLSRYRVSQAKAMLKTGEKSLTEIALTVGFSDGAHFSHVFQREVGVSPGAYRRGQREAKKPNLES